jgi:hypothetical protein
MCTVSIVRTPELLRVVCNRDESRQRPRAHPPFITMSAGRQVLTPQDPKGGGTWIAANGAGLVFALLNIHDCEPVERVIGPSRGTIIPRVADCEVLDEVTWRVAEIPHDTFAPCRLLVTDGDRLVTVAIGHGRHDVETHAVERTLLFTSSSLGDALVDGPRRMLFDQMVADAKDLEARQGAYHAHRWRDRPALSVHMSRPDACTVSTTIVEVTAREVRMTYAPAHCDDAGTPVGLIINRENVLHDHPAWAHREHAAV